jgi:hypothetical protein
MIFDYRGMTGKRLETRLFAQSLKTLVDAFVDFDLRTVFPSDALQRLGEVD